MFSENATPRLKRLVILHKTDEMPSLYKYTHRKNIVENKKGGVIHKIFCSCFQSLMKQK